MIKGKVHGYGVYNHAYHRQKTGTATCWLHLLLFQIPKYMKLWKWPSKEHCLIKAVHAIPTVVHSGKDS